jgi:hypothetical protein
VHHLDLYLLHSGFHRPSDNKYKLELSLGIISFLSAIPLIFLLISAPEYGREPLYYLQIGLMLLWIIVTVLVDYILKLGFRNI